METTGFTETQLEVREAVGAICSRFPNTYWQERDQNGQDPKDFHAALAKDGWLGIALPEAFGGSGFFSHDSFNRVRARKTGEKNHE